ncbi:tyrosine-type recombinase/integrase [Nonomuraea sp. M3C6]|uniref:Tyrosine-type recombinase/integrase n=1 Tax=Nonomuraea marmarensis TaxID=3351344 RepID=A0ABW7A8J2_9ACTN
MLGEKLEPHREGPASKPACRLLAAALTVTAQDHILTALADADTAQVLRAHRQQQLQERLAMSEAWTDSGFVFTQPDGTRLHPQHVSDQFLWLAYLAGLPPIRLHDLRHGAASLMLAAGVEMKVVQETLGHTSSAFTADTYTSVYPQVATAAAEKTAALLFGDEDQGESGKLISLRSRQSD